MKKTGLFLLALCCGSFLSAQKDLRYRNLVFKSATREKNLYYGEATPEKQKKHRLDIYTPDQDSLQLRPLIILLHGGGFKFGSKNNSRMKIWGKHFARMGYVCAAVSYRLSKKKPLSRFNDLVEASIDAIADVDQAINYLKRNRLKFGLDTNRIILAGHSAGGIIALNAVYGSTPELRQLVDPKTVLTPVNHNPERVIAVVNFWGAIFDTAWLSNTRVPIVSVHGSKDRVVPINFGDSPMYGSAAVHRQARKLQIPNALKVFEGEGHELQRHFNPIYAGPVARRRWRQAADFASAFLYDNFFKSKALTKR